MAKRWLKTESDLLVELRNQAERYKSDAELARAFGISRSHMCRVLNGAKPITKKIADCLGYEAQLRFVRYEHRG